MVSVFSGGPGRWRRWAWAVVRWALVLLPLGWFAARVDTARLLDALRTPSPAPLAAAFGLQLLSVVSVAARTRLLMQAVLPPGSPVPGIASLARTWLVSAYAALLPVPVADDAVRAARTAHVYAGAATAVGVVAVERLLGLAAVVLLGAVGFFGWAAAAPPWVTALGGLAVAFGLAVFTLVVPALGSQQGWARGLLTRWPRLERMLHELPRFRSWKALLAPFGLSLLSNSLAAVAMVLVVRSVDAEASWARCLPVLPSVLLSLAIPLTPGRLGQREVVFVTFFGSAGVSADHAIAASLLAFVLGAALGLLGGLVVLWEKVWPGSSSLKA